MACRDEGPRYGEGHSDYLYGPLLFEREDRKAILEAGGILPAVRAGILAPDSGPVEAIVTPGPNQSISSILVELLCTACKALRRNKTWDDIVDDNPDLKTWFELHQKRDDAKTAREAAVAAEKAERDAILAKLTPAEQKKLGLIK